MAGNRHSRPVIALVDVLGEALRNLWSGVTRAPLWAAAAVLVAGVCAGTDVLTVTDLSRAALTYREIGGATYIIDSEHAVDGARCANLAASTGVISAAALTLTDQTLVPQTLPRSPIPVVTATSGLGAVLGGSDALSAGVLLPDDLAATLGVDVGEDLVTITGQSVRVAATFAYPDDGRRRDLGYVAVEQTAAVGAFDSCWITMWPPDQTTAAELLRSTLQPGGSDGAKVGQLNTTQGVTYTPHATFAGRNTRLAWVPACVAGMILGMAAVQSRRLELASALHAGVTRPRLVLQVLVETAAWSAAAAAVTSAVTLYMSMRGNPDPWHDAFLIGLRPIVACTAAICLGAAGAAVTISENRLFAYFKEH